MPDLKPCPFCGEPAEMDTQQHFVSYKGERLTQIAVYCTRCPAHLGGCKEDFPDVSAEWIAELWNARAYPSLPTVPLAPLTRQDVIDGLREAYRGMLAAEQKITPTLKGYPDMEAILKHIEAHGLPPKT